MTSGADGKVIVNSWEDDRPEKGVRGSHIIDSRIGCEGIDVCRYTANSDTEISLPSDAAHIFSLLEGEAILHFSNGARELSITAGTHLYVPPSQGASFRFLTESSAIHAFAEKDRDHGENLVVHNERFLAPTRFILTPQYLSRRAFLNRDHTLVSKSGDRVAWFHTTMFDTQGLPPNREGLPVFKMSYDHQSEINVVYNVQGQASVRFAKHPYVDAQQQHWSDWRSLDKETTYYLNEGADGPDIERIPDAKTVAGSCLRNRHEVYIAPGGHVSLCCMFDPGPTGLETHQPGEYSSYAPVSETIRTAEYRAFLESVARADEIIRTLSMKQASVTGALDYSSPEWVEFEAQRAKAVRAEQATVRNSGNDRKAIMEPWRICHLP
jgi:hypothetical protein